MFLKTNFSVEIFGDVLKNIKHRANNATNDAIRPILIVGHHLGFVTVVDNFPIYQKEVKIEFKQMEVK